MKFTKVIRSYMEKTLTEKRLAANKADPEAQAYLNRKQCAENALLAACKNKMCGTKSRSLMHRAGEIKNVD